MSWAKPGVKCVCIDSAPRGTSEGIPAWIPVEGEIYTVSFVYHRGDGKSGLVLVEQTDNRRFYEITRFRPLVTKTIEQDVQMFKRIAETAPSLEDAE